MRRLAISTVFSLITSYGYGQATISDSQTTTGSGVAGSFTINLPATVNAGDILLVHAAVDTGPTNPTWPGGWTGLGSGFSEGVVRLWRGWREADGTEDGGTVVLTSGTSTEEFAAIAYAISGADDPDTNPPENGTNAEGLPGTNADCVTVTPAAGSKEYLWIAPAAIDAGPSVTGYPTNMPDNRANVDNGAAIGLAIATATTTAASIDPDAFAHGNGQWTCRATAIHPAAAAAGGVGHLGGAHLGRAHTGGAHIP
jgi:hypothetical protein